MIYDLQKASMWKRVSAWLLDAILLCIIATLLAAIVARITGYDHYAGVYDERCTAIEAQFGVSRTTTMAEIEQMTPEQRANWDAANHAIAADPQAVHAYSMCMQLIVLIASLAILGAFLVMEFFVPLLLHNGQTVGKKVFGIAVMRMDGVRVTPMMMFIRAVLGKCTVETMLPVMALLCITQLKLVSLLIVFAVVMANLLLLILTREHAALHDKMACTVTVDLASQLIFNTPEELIAYKQKVAAEKAARQPY